MNTYKLYTDGSFQESLQIAGIGGYLLDEKLNRLFEFSEQLNDPDSYRYHEVLALLYGLEKALQHGVTQIECFSDDRSIKDIFNKEFIADRKDDISVFRMKIFDLKSKFSFIKFHHLPRKENKEADKLAGKSLRLYKEDFLPNRKRNFFKGQESNLLTVPNLFCEEDFYEINQLEQFASTRRSLSHYYFIHLVKNDDITIQIYSAQRNQRDHKSIRFSLLQKQHCEQKKLFSTTLTMMTEVFNLSHYHGNVGLIFHATNSLLRTDMVLRKRGTLHQPNTLLIQKFIESCSQFKNIILHNEQKMINVYSDQVIKPNDDVINLKKTEELHVKLNEYINILKELGDDSYYLGKNPSIEEPFSNSVTVEKIQKKYFGEFLRISLLVDKLSNIPIEVNMPQKIEILKAQLTHHGVKLKL